MIELGHLWEFEKIDGKNRGVTNELGKNIKLSKSDAGYYICSKSREKARF